MSPILDTNHSTGQKSNIGLSKRVHRHGAGAPEQREGQDDGRNGGKCERHDPDLHQVPCAAHAMMHMYVCEAAGLSLEAH